MVVPFVGSHWKGPVVAGFQEVFGAVVGADGWNGRKIEKKPVGR
jgi:hypothetical protein